MKLFETKNFSFYQKKPYVIFEIENFLDENEFQILKNNYPAKNYFPTKEDNSKETFSKNNQKFPEFLDKNKCWANFFRKFEDKNFMEKAYIFSLYEILKVRGIKFVKKWTKEQNNIIEKIFYRKIFLDSYFALQNSNQIVYPHTDARTKLISMIYYISGVKESGTEFWDIKKNKDKWENWNNKHLRNPEEIKEFRNDSELIMKSEFKENKLVGFIKTNYSWHSVLDVGHTNNDNLRKTLNLFYRF